MSMMVRPMVFAAIWVSGDKVGKVVLDPEPDDMATVGPEKGNALV